LEQAAAEAASSFKRAAEALGEKSVAELRGAGRQMFHIAESVKARFDVLHQMDEKLAAMSARVDAIGRQFDQAQEREIREANQKLHQDTVRATNALADSVRDLRESLKTSRDVAQRANVEAAPRARGALPSSGQNSVFGSGLSAGWPSTANAGVDGATSAARQSTAAPAEPTRTPPQQAQPQRNPQRTAASTMPVDAAPENPASPPRIDPASVMATAEIVSMPRSPDSSGEF
jgi:hypothetical protein